MRKKYRYLWFALICFPLFAGAQIINIDRSDTAAYTSQPKSSVNFSTGLEVDRQQITLWDATNTLEWMRQQKKELLLAAASYRFTYNGPDDILNAGYIHLRYRHNYKHSYQPETFVQYQWDNKRGLIHRALAGINMRYNFWRGSTWDLNAGLGLMYEAEKWNYDAVDSSKLPLNLSPVTNHFIKFNAYLRFDWKASENSDIALNIFLQTRPDRFQPRIAPHVQWNINAGRHVGFSVSFSGIYDHMPVVPIHKFYYSLSNSILIKM